MKIKTAVTDVHAVVGGPSRPSACRGGSLVVLRNEPFVISQMFASRTPRSSGSDPETDVGAPP